MNPGPAYTTQYERITLGGMDVLLAPRPGTGLLAATMLVRCGAADEARGEYGLASFTAEMLMRGTRRRGRKELACDLESLGAIAGTGAGLDHCTLDLRVAAAQAPEALGLFFEILRQPAFDPREVENERLEALAHLRMQQDDKFGYTYREYLKAMFAGHGYGHAVEGEEADVRAITPEACHRWHEETFRPEAGLLAIVGDLTREACLEMIEQHLAGWQRNVTMRSRQVNEPAPPQSRTLELTRPDLQQGFVVAGYRTPTLTHPDFPALRLASAALGEGFAGRIFTNLRDRRGLAYACGASLHFHRLAGHEVLYIGTKPESIDEARQGLLDEADAVREILLDDETLGRAREYVIGKFLMRAQSHGQRAGRLAGWEDLTGNAALADAWPDCLRAVTADQVREAARRWWVEPTLAILRPQS